MVEPALFGPLDTLLAPYVEWIVLGLVVANLLTRHLAHRRHVSQVAEGGDAVDRHPLHEASNVLIVLGAFYYLTLHHHSGVVLSVLAVGTVIADIFEFEARNVEARNDLSIERPKGAIAASLLLVAYAAYKAAFFLIDGPFSAIV